MWRGGVIAEDERGRLKGFNLGPGSAAGAHGEAGTAVRAGTAAQHVGKPIQRSLRGAANTAAVTQHFVTFVHSGET